MQHVTSGTDSHYFAESTSAPSQPRSITLSLPDVSIELTSDRGVFSTDRVDPGTKFLLMEAAQPGDAGTILDLGCGYGPIALVAAMRAPSARVVAIDVNERARDLTGANAKRLGLSNVEVQAPAEVPADMSFDLVLSNPPIRIGKEALHGLLATWLERLSEHGRAEFVVQKHLGSDSLAQWLTKQGWPTTKRRSRQGYRILDVEARS